MIEAALPDNFCPEPTADLIRLGRDHDGGYLVDLQDVVRSDGLISLGINDDWSFERSFFRRHPVPIEAYDGSVDFRSFLRRAVRDSLRLNHPRIALRSVRILMDYVWFFSGRRRHLKYFVASTDLMPQVPMAEVFRASRERGVRNPFLKIDIEGSEYGLLDELLKHANETAGLVIEFHDCSDRLATIGDFINEYPLRLVHIHANNYGPVCNSRIPTVLELTFSSGATEAVSPTLPHPLDMPNERNTAEILISFS